MRTIANPTRGCGNLKEGGLYLKGLGFSEDGCLPPFVKFEHPILYQKPQFRAWEKVNGELFLLAHRPRVSWPVGMNEGLKRSNTVALLDGTFEEGEHIDLETEHGRHMARTLHKGIRYDAGIKDQMNFGSLEEPEAFDMVMWVGAKKFYPEPRDFIKECEMYGISKRIPVTAGKVPVESLLPKVYTGTTRLFIVHPKAVQVGEAWYPGVIGYAYLDVPIYTHKEGVPEPEWMEKRQTLGDIEIVEVGPAEEGPDPRVLKDNKSLDEFDNAKDAPKTPKRAVKDDSGSERPTTPEVPRNDGEGQKEGTGEGESEEPTPETFNSLLLAITKWGHLELFLKEVEEHICSLRTKSGKVVTHMTYKGKDLTRVTYRAGNQPRSCLIKNLHRSIEVVEVVA